MIYNSPETIPAKIYFKIIEGAPLTLLTDDEKVSANDLEIAWNKIEGEYKNESKQDSKVLDISKRMESLSARLESVLYSVCYLKNIKDDQLIDLLKSFGYNFNWKKTDNKDGDEISEAIYQNDLERIERESEALKIKIDRLLTLMPAKEEDEEDNSVITFDENVLMYSAFNGLGYIDPNKIPLTQYDALINNGNKKMDALEKQNNKNGKRK